MKKYDIIVIGGGPAGITLAKILGKKWKMGVIRPEDYSLIYCALPYVIEEIVPIQETFKKDSLVTDAGADLIRGRVKKIEFREKHLFLENGESYSYGKLVIATGADPVRPQIPGTELSGVHVFKTREDLVRIDDAVKKQGVRKAVVVGAGAIGIELAQALNKIGVQCHLVDFAKSVLPNLIDPELAEDLHEELKRVGIELHLGSRVSSVLGKDLAEDIVLDTGKVISIKNGGFVVFAVGMKATTDVFKESGLEIGRQGIVVNNKMETNIENVYAVGDCAQFVSGITGDVMMGKLATNAVPMARILGDNLSGADRSYKGFFNGAATKVGPFFAGGTGLTESSLSGDRKWVVGNSEMTTAFPVMPNATKIKMKLIVEMETRKILGGQIVAGTPVTDKIDVVTLAIQNGLTVEDLADLSYSAQPYQSFYPANNPIVACARDILKKLD